MSSAAARLSQCVYIALFVNVFLLAPIESASKLQSCNVAQLQCHSRTGCQMALNNFFIHCHAVIQDEQLTTCPTDCKHALVSLLSTEDEAGVAFINCDCQNKGMCSERKKRVQICQREVMGSMHVLKDNAPPVSCNLARWICEADTLCLAALQYYYDHCSRLFSGLRCTSRCRNSLEILSRQPHASKLRSCMCDGSEDYDCQALKVNTERMCFHHRSRGKHKNTSSEGELAVGSSLTSAENYIKKHPSGHKRKRSRRRKRRNRTLKGWKKTQRKRKRRPRRRKRKKRQRDED